MPPKDSDPLKSSDELIKECCEEVELVSDKYEKFCDKFLSGSDESGQSLMP